MRFPMRSLYLLLFFIASSTAGMIHPFTYQSLHECAKAAIISPGTQDVRTSNHTREHGEIVKVIGLTWNCVFFVGFLHNILEESDSNTETVPYDPKLAMQCKNIKTYLMKDARKQTPVAIIVKEAGNRIKVQSAVNGKLIKHTDQAIYMEVDMFNRNGWVQTQAIDKGYHILRVTHMHYRVYVVTRNHHHIRLYELIVGTSDKNKLYAELKSMGNAGFDQLLADPTDDRMIRVVSNLDASNHVGNEDEDVNSDNSTSYTVYKAIPSEDLQLIDGFSVHRRDFEKMLMMEGPAVMVPLVSLMGQTYRGVSFKEKHEERASNFRKEKIVINNHICLIAVHQAEFYYHKLEKKPISERSEGEYHVPNSKSVAYWIANTRFMSEGATHRRMAYPHTRHEPKRSLGSLETFEYLTKIAMIFGAMMLVSCIWNAIAMCIRRRIKAKRSRSSHSTA